jgi:hypothetical protein
MSSRTHIAIGCIIGVVSTAYALAVYRRTQCRSEEDGEEGGHSEKEDALETPVLHALEYLNGSFKDEEREKKGKKDKKDTADVDDCSVSFKGDFSLALQAFAVEHGPEYLHFAAHSHHMWPDVSLRAQGSVCECVYI